jgi:methylglutaconyl-CoA hydratase
VAEDILLIDDTDPTRRICTLNRPAKRNALSIELAERLADAIESADEPRRRVLILRGNGPVFCAGLDLQEAADASNSQRSARALARLYLCLARSPLITIATAQGGAFGGGAGLLPACDFAVAGDDLRIGFPEVHRGLIAGLVTALLLRQLPQRRVRELILLGRTIGAQEAREIGLIHSIVLTSTLAIAANDLATAASHGAPGAIARTKQLLNDLSARPLEEDIERALKDHLAARNSAESKEGIAAFLEGRKPNWPLREAKKK